MKIRVWDDLWWRRRRVNPAEAVIAGGFAKYDELVSYLVLGWGC